MTALLHESAKVSSPRQTLDRSQLTFDKNEKIVWLRSQDVKDWYIRCWAVMMKLMMMCVCVYVVVQLCRDRGWHLSHCWESSVCLMDSRHWACCCILLPHHLSCISHLPHLVHWMLWNSLQEQNHSSCCMYSTHAQLFFNLRPSLQNYSKLGYCRLGQYPNTNSWELLWQNFYSPDALHVTQPTTSKHWRMTVLLTGDSMLSPCCRDQERCDGCLGCLDLRFQGRIPTKK